MIVNEEEYAAALEALDEVFDSHPGDPNFEYAQNLVNEIEAYEDLHYPISD
jgi:antitoxin component HigA of HigAB toxin-antitoxin module